MQAVDLRRRLLERVEEVSAGGDEEATARVTSYARALLISLAGHPAHSEVDVRDLTISTRTAALILGMHPEYVRFLIRSERLRATKSNGEFRIPLGEVVRFVEVGLKTDLGKVGMGAGMLGLSIPFWPPLSPQSESGSA